MAVSRVGKQPRRWLGQLLTGACLLFAVTAVAQPRTVQMSLGGRTTLVDVTAPAATHAAASHEAVILAHGFTRSRVTMGGHAAALAQAGYWAVVPDLPYLMDSRDNARALRDLMTALRNGAAGRPLDRFVLVGFSAGGLAALLAASEPGVAGYIGLDPFDRPNGIGLDAARKLKIPTYLLRGPSAACNAYSIAEPWVKALPELVEDRRILQASHCDFEAPTDWLCRAVCGDTDASRQAIVRDFVMNAVRHLLPPASATG
jgi:dienelactone hydrolase